VRKITNFIERAKKVHGNKYDYSLVDYINNSTKIKIICPIHGIFEQTPYSHLLGKICFTCSRYSRRYTSTKFIKKAKQIHGDKYDYSLVEYVHNAIKIKIICPNHGIFIQLPSNHLNRKSGCPQCTGLTILTITEFIEKAKQIHGDKYDYSLVDYKNNRTKIKIICPKHGIFEQTPNSHLSKKTGCPICSKNKKLNSIEFIEKAKQIHGDKYDYSLVDYINNRIKIKIICSEHGVFEQRPNSHLSKKTGCPICKSSKGEIEIINYLIKNNIIFESESIILNCKSINVLPFDFYLPEYNIYIEYDGIQHFKPINYFGGKKAFIELKKRDKIKSKYCHDNNIKLIRISYIDNIEEKLKSLLAEALNLT